MLELELVMVDGGEEGDWSEVSLTSLTRWKTG